jgi:ferrous iron transport protein A
VTVAQLKIGERAVITDILLEEIPLKLIEMGCLPGCVVELIQIAPLSDPLYLDIDGTQLAIRKETAKHIIVEKQD